MECKGREVDENGQIWKSSGKICEDDFISLNGG